MKGNCITKKTLRILTKNDLNPEVLQHEFDSGLWHKEIAKKYNVSWRTIYTYVKQWNLSVERKNKKKIKEKLICKDCGKQFTELHDGLCHNCWNKQNNINKELITVKDCNSIYFNDIINLRKEGCSYSEIATILHCSKSTVSYCLSEKTKMKTKQKTERRKEHEPWKFYLCKRLGNFKKRESGKGRVDQCLDWNKKFRTAVSKFRKSLPTMPNKNYTYKDVLDYFGGTTVTCELTGETIDLLVDDYNIDHIVPVARGGTNELDNMAFTIPDANAAKHDMTNEEFVELCVKVCKHFGYTVTKN